MANENLKEQMDKVLFSNLILMLSSAAMQYMGKLVNPMTNKTEMNLDAAQLNIDMIAMLKAKTEGNRDDEEEQLLTHTLSTLQVNYVETSSAPSEDSKSGEDTSDEPEETPADDAEEPVADTNEPADAEVPDEKASGKDPKFHKSYGE